jgi:hypothetical protein
MIRGVLLLMLALVASPAIAHKASDAYLTIERDGAALRGQWDIALRDLDNALGLDANGDGDITWGEVRARHADIAAYALQRLDVSSGGERCALSATAQMIDSHTPTAPMRCSHSRANAQRRDRRSRSATGCSKVSDPQHRGLLNLIENGQSRSVVFVPMRPGASSAAIRPDCGRSSRRT